MVAHSLWERGATGSNPVTPTKCCLLDLTRRGSGAPAPRSRQGRQPALQAAPVSEPTHGLDGRCMRAQPSADRADDGVDDVAAALVVVSPDVTQDRDPRHDLAPLGVQVVHDGELERRQRDWAFRTAAARPLRDPARSSPLYRALQPPSARPPVDGARPEIQDRGVVLGLVQLDSGVVQMREAEFRHHRGELGEVADRRVHPPHIGSQGHVGALDVQPAGGLCRGRTLLRPPRPASDAGTGRVPVRNGMISQVTRPRSSEGISEKGPPPDARRIRT